jgi:hypothetical protein
MTLTPFLRRSFFPPKRPATDVWKTELVDPDVGTVSLSGRLLSRSRRRIVVAIHGLGGSTASGYMGLVLRAADQAGLSCLLLNCRGADRAGDDLYHSGLVADIDAALSSEELRDFSRVDLFGYSIGGHIALRYATMDSPDERLGRVAAIGSPLDLRASAHDFDKPAMGIYRGHVMDSLKEIYTASYQRRPRGIVPEAARKIGRIVDWDHQVVAPRFGFQSADHYYETQSVAERLDSLRVPALYVGATCDPMVRVDAVRGHLEHSPVETVWDERAGHLGFRDDFDLGLDAPRGLESQVLSWLSRE